VAVPLARRANWRSGISIRSPGAQPAFARRDPEPAGRATLREAADSPVDREIRATLDNLA